MSYKTRCSSGGEGWGLICHTDGSWQGEDTVHQPSHRSAHPFLFPQPPPSVLVGVKRRKMAPRKGEGNDGTQALMKINESKHLAKSVGQLAPGVHAVMDYSWRFAATNKLQLFLKYFLRWPSSSFCFHSHAPEPLKYYILCIIFSSRPCPHYVERSLHSRKGHHPVDSAQRSMLLFYPVSRWLQHCLTVLLFRFYLYVSNGETSLFRELLFF